MTQYAPPIELPKFWGVLISRVRTIAMRVSIWITRGRVSMTGAPSEQPKGRF